MTRKWLAVVLAIAMLLSMMPMGLAEDVLESDAIEEIVEEPAEIVEEPAEEPAAEEPAPVDEEEEAPVEQDGSTMFSMNVTSASVGNNATSYPFIANFPLQTSNTTLYSGYASIVPDDSASPVLTLTSSKAAASDSERPIGWKGVWAKSGDAEDAETSKEAGLVLPGDVSLKVTTDGSVNALGSHNYTIYFAPIDNKAGASFNYKGGTGEDIQVYSYKLTLTVTSTVATDNIVKVTIPTTAEAYVGNTTAISATLNGGIGNPIAAQVYWEVAPAYTSKLSIAQDATDKKKGLMTGLAVNDVGYPVVIRAYAYSNGNSSTGTPVYSNECSVTVKSGSIGIPVQVDVTPATTNTIIGSTVYVNASVKGFSAFGTLTDLPNESVTWTVNGASASSMASYVTITPSDSTNKGISVIVRVKGTYTLAATTANGKVGSCTVTATESGKISKITIEPDYFNVAFSGTAAKTFDVNPYLRFWTGNGSEGYVEDTAGTYSHAVTWTVVSSNDSTKLSQSAGVVSIPLGAGAGQWLKLQAMLNTDSTVFATTEVWTVASDGFIASMIVNYTKEDLSTSKIVGASTYMETTEVEPVASDVTAPASDGAYGLYSDYLYNSESKWVHNTQVAASSGKYFDTDTDFEDGTLIPTVKVGSSIKFKALYSQAFYDRDDHGFVHGYTTYNEDSFKDEMTAAQPSTEWVIEGLYGTDDAKVTSVTYADYIAVGKYTGVVTVKQHYPTGYFVIKATNMSNADMSSYIKVYTAAGAVKTIAPYVKLTGASTNLTLSTGNILDLTEGQIKTGKLVPSPASATAKLLYKLENLNSSWIFATGSMDNDTTNGFAEKPEFTIVGLAAGTQVFKYTIKQEDPNDNGNPSYSGYLTVRVSKAGIPTAVPTAVPTIAPTGFNFALTETDVVVDLVGTRTHQLAFAANSDVQNWAEVSWLNSVNYSEYFIIDNGMIMGLKATATPIAATASVTRLGVTKTVTVNVSVVDGAAPTTAPVITKFSILEDNAELTIGGAPYQLGLDGNIATWDNVKWTNRAEWSKYCFIIDGLIYPYAATPAEGIVATATCSEATTGYDTDSVRIFINTGSLPTDAPTMAPTTVPTTAPIITPKPTDVPLMHQIAYVNGTSVNLRADATSGSASLAKLRKGTMVEVIEEGASWTYVNTIEGYGYISNSLLTDAEFGDYSDLGYYVTASSLRFRSTPNGAVVTGVSPLANGVYVTVLDVTDDGDWAYVDYMGNYGYVSTAYLEAV